MFPDWNSIEEFNSVGAGLDAWTGLWKVGLVGGGEGGDIGVSYMLNDDEDSLMSWAKGVGLWFR